MYTITFECLRNLDTPVQVNVNVTHHTLNDNGITTEKPLIFILDEVKSDEEKKGRKKRKKDTGPTHKNFGAKLSVDKMKGTDRFVVAWRMRLLGIKV